VTRRKFGGEIKSATNAAVPAVRIAIGFRSRLALTFQMFVPSFVLRASDCGKIAFDLFDGPDGVIVTPSLLIDPGDGLRDENRIEFVFPTQIVGVKRDATDDQVGINAALDCLYEFIARRFFRIGAEALGIYGPELVELGDRFFDIEGRLLFGRFRAKRGIWILDSSIWILDSSFWALSGGLTPASSAPRRRGLPPPFPFSRSRSALALSLTMRLEWSHRLPTG
jgi:hypothetical protein